MDTRIPQMSDTEAIKKVILLLQLFQSPEYGYMSELMKQMENMQGQIKELNSQLGEMRAQLPQKKGIKERTEGIYQKMSERGKDILQAIKDFIAHIAQRGREWLAGIRQKGESKLYSFLEQSGIQEKLTDMQQRFEKGISEMENNIQRLDSIENEFRQSGRHLKNAAGLITGKDNRDGGEVKNTHFLSKIPRLMLKVYKAGLDKVNKAISAYGRLENSVVSQSGHVREQTPENGMEAVKRGMESMQYVGKENGMEAVRQDGMALQYVKQTPEICMEAVKQSGWALQYVKGQQNPKEKQQEAER